MAKDLSAADRVFLDAAYAIALSCPADQFHAAAIALAEDLEVNGARLITTSAVLLEIGNALAKLQHRRAAAQLLAALCADPTVEIVPLSDQLFDLAMKLFSERQDKEWGLTDCLSFVVMSERGITQALTTDEHFQQAGFKVLLRKPAP
jgi:predicted nucleic acid-binding protein